jgi:hypothetical protein
VPSGGVVPSVGVGCAANQRKIGQKQADKRKKPDRSG